MRWLSVCLALMLLLTGSVLSLPVSAVTPPNPTTPTKTQGDLPYEFTEPLFDYPVRDTCIRYMPEEDEAGNPIAGGGWYYLIGTTGAPTWWTENEGVRMWKSRDMEEWLPVETGEGSGDIQNLVWAVSNAEWTAGNALWAPEFHYLNGTYYITYSISGPAGNGIIYSTSGLPEGPYEEVYRMVDGEKVTRLENEIDGSLFQDDDGKIYYIWQDGNIQEVTFDPVNKGEITYVGEEHQLLVDVGGQQVTVGFEGVYLFKIGDTYYLDCSEFNGDTGMATYDCNIATSKNIYGPYENLYVAIRHGGHNMFFYDKDGQLWSTFFGNDGMAPFTERPAALRVELTEDGRIQPVYSDIINLAPYGTAEASSQWNGDYGASYAIDAVMNTRWAGQQGPGTNYGLFPEDLTVDLGAPKAVVMTKLYFERPDNAYQYKIEYSLDKENWEPYADRTENTATGAPEDHGVVVARYFRVTVTGTSYYDPLASIREFQIWGKNQSDLDAAMIASGIVSLELTENGDAIAMPAVPQGAEVTIVQSSDPAVVALDGTVTPGVVLQKVQLTLQVSYQGETALTETLQVVIPNNGQYENLALNRPATATTEWSADYNAAKAVDGDDTTRWCSIISSEEDRKNPQTLTVDLGEVCTIYGVDTVFEFPGDCVKYVVETSYDGQTWNVFADRRDNTAVASPYGDAGFAVARYARITVTGMPETTDHLASIWEFQVLGERSVPEYTVTFEPNNGAAATEVTVQAGETVEAPANPVRTGYTFAGWYTDAALSNAYDFDVPVFANLSLYAKWNKNAQGGGSVSSYTITVIQADGGEISPASARVEKGADKTFTITPDEGYRIADVTVDGRSVGAVRSYTFEDVAASHTITARFEKEEAGAFVDVDAADWYYDAVSYVAEHGLMDGVGSGKFNPDGAVTRAMVWTVLARMAGEDTDGGSTWYAKAQEWAMETGVSDGTNPMNAITREQLAAMLYRYVGSPAVSGSLDAYPDAGQVSDWAADALVWATEEEIVNGIGGNLSPKTGATRAQLATMLMRLQENF